MKHRIMIVEDESIIAMDLRFMLEDNGYDVVATANDGEKAIELAHLYRPDLILMDIKMPKLNGLKASQIIGNQLGIHIVMMTAYSQNDFIEMAKQDHILGYIVKPVSESNLFPAIEVALHQSGKSRKLHSEIKRAKQQVENRKLIERAKGQLMKMEHLSEEDAYQKLRTMSMSQQKEMSILAQEIIEKYKGLS